MPRSKRRHRLLQGRLVYPEADQKQQFDSLIVHHRQAGLEALLIDRCGELAAGRTFAGGILALSVEGINAAVCLVDYCSDARWLGRGFGVNQRCIYVTLGPDRAPRMLQEDAVACVEFVDILLGLKDLPTSITQRATTPPVVLANVDPFVYSLGARPNAPESRERPEPRRVSTSVSQLRGYLSTDSWPSVLDEAWQWTSWASSCSASWMQRCLVALSSQ